MRLDPKIIVEELKKNQGKIRKTGRSLGISPGTVCYWKKRSRSKGLTLKLKTRGLKRKKTGPKHKRGTILSLEERLSAKSIRESKGFCARKIKFLLNIPHHHNTIHRYLDSQGYIHKKKNHRRPYYQETTHMYLKNTKTLGKLQMDVKYVTPELSGLKHTLFLYAIIDIYSRWKQGVILPLLDQGYSIEALKLCLPLFPFKPDFIQTDNGLEFQKRFHEFVTETLNMEHHHIHKSNPNENAIIERSFRTDEEEFFFFKMKKPIDEIDLNIQYQKYLKEYNEERPHLGIDLMTPKEKVLSVQ